MKVRSANLKAQFLERAIDAVINSQITDAGNKITLEMVQEYKDEFEHQDGQNCWEEYFNNATEIMIDLALYIDSASSICKPIIPEDN